MAWFKKRGDNPGRESPAPADSRLSAALALAVGPARMHQLSFGEQVVADRGWNLDFGAGVIVFGDTPYPIGFIGSESHRDNTFLWGSENINDFPDAILTDVRDFIDRVAAVDLPGVVGPSLALSDIVTGHNLSSLVAVRCAQPACYYRCPYDGGAAFVLVKNLPPAVFEPVDMLGAINLMNDLIAHLPLDHRRMARGLLDAVCERVEATGRELTGHFAGGRTLRIHFDELGRLARMTGDA